MRLRCRRVWRELAAASLAPITSLTPGNCVTALVGASATELAVICVAALARRLFTNVLVRSQCRYDRAAAALGCDVRVQLALRADAELSLAR